MGKFRILVFMNDLKTDSFFALGAFRHKELFEGEFVWSALHRLKEYIEGVAERKIEIEISEGVSLIDAETISIGEGTKIEPGVLIRGPCVIGKNCAIRHGAYLRGGVILGDGCTVGHSCEVKHSIFLDGSSASHLVYVGDSIIGNKANLSAGVKCANLRLDRKEVSVSWGGLRTKTGLKKFGAIIGDRAQVGCNCVLNPGTLIGADSVCYPLLNIGGFVPSNSRVKGTRAFSVEAIDDPKSILKEMRTFEVGLN